MLTTCSCGGTYVLDSELMKDFGISVWFCDKCRDAYSNARDYYTQITVGNHITFEPMKKESDE